MKRILLLLFIGFSLSGISQAKNDTLNFNGLFDSLSSFVNQVNLDELQSEFKNVLNDSAFNNALSEMFNDSIIGVFKQDVQLVKDDIKTTLNSEEFKQQRELLIQEFKAIIEELERN